MHRDYCAEYQNLTTQKEKRQTLWHRRDDDALTQLHGRVLTPRNVELKKDKNGFHLHHCP
jgi:hypothetical protein